MQPSQLPLHLLAQQVLALALQERGVGARDWWGWIGQMPGFAALDQDDVKAALEFMLESRILLNDSGLLSLGPEGEQTFGRRHFLELLSSFVTDVDGVRAITRQSVQEVVADADD